VPAVIPTYRERLRVEGAVLAAAAAIACLLLVAGVAEASEQAASTVAQLVLAVLLVVVLGPIGARRSIAGARPIAPGEQLTGQPTALWKPPLVMLVLIAAFVAPGRLGAAGGGWDAGLRIAGGCLLVGLAQALLIERIVAADEARSGRTYLRLPGSSAIRGTKLGFF
jgi:hypothetical protein